jgi:enoyl-CoA hydratase/carnithine racemase
VLRQGWRGDDHAEPPDKLNALNGEMYAGILAALDQTDSDDSVRAVIVTGAARAFCAGRT